MILMHNNWIKPTDLVKSEFPIEIEYVAYYTLDKSDGMISQEDH